MLFIERFHIYNVFQNKLSHRLIFYLILSLRSLRLTVNFEVRVYLCMLCKKKKMLVIDWYYVLQWNYQIFKKGRKPAKGPPPCLKQGERYLTQYSNGTYAPHAIIHHKNSLILYRCPHVIENICIQFYIWDF